MMFYFPNSFLLFPYHYQYYYITSKTTLKLPPHTLGVMVTPQV